MLPKELKATSSIIQVSSFALERAPNSFTSVKVDLQLNPLDNEVFVVYAANLDCRAPDLVSGTKTVTAASISTTERNDVGSIGNSNVIATQNMEAIYDGTAAITFDQQAGESPSTALPYMSIIATNDFFINIEGTGNTTEKVVSVRLWGVRAKADAAVYSALVQSELLSA